MYRMMVTSFTLRTMLNDVQWSANDYPKTSTSSRYTNDREYKIPARTFSTPRWKKPSLPVNPKGRRLNL